MFGVEQGGEEIRLFDGPPHDENRREYVSVKEAARRSGLSEDRIRGIKKNGHTPGAITPGGRDVLLPWDELLEYLDRRKMGRPRKK